MEAQRAIQTILKSWPELDYSGQRRDLFAALAFLAGSIYRWQKEFFENGAAAFKARADRTTKANSKWIIG